MPSPENLLVISHVVHRQHDGQVYAYGPYAREIDIWADLFPRVTIAAPCRYAPPPGDHLAFSRPNIVLWPQKETGGDTLAAKARQVFALPALVCGLVRAMCRADAVHVRCPGNLGLLGALLAPFFSPYLIAKYAGQWDGYTGEPWTIRLQRAVLRSRWWKGPVTVYGRWPNQPAHVVPFFTSVMTAEQVARAVSVASTKHLSSPLRVLFSGRLSFVKRVEALLEAVKIAVDDGLQLEVVVVGDGPERGRLGALVDRLAIQEQVRFVGAAPFEHALRWYEWAHCLVLPSVNSEGWPKVIAEAMCYGLMCVAVDHGQVPAMLSGRGILLKKGTPQEIAEALLWVARCPSESERMMRNASGWARQYSLEALREALAQLLARQWNIPLCAPNAPLG